MMSIVALRAGRPAASRVVVPWLAAVSIVCHAGRAGADERITYLIETLDESRLNYRVRVQTIQSLEQIAVTATGESLTQIVGALTKSLKDTNALVRYAAASSLIGLGRSSLRSIDLPGVIRELEALDGDPGDPDEDVRQLVRDGVGALQTRLAQLDAAGSGGAGGGSGGSTGPVPAKFYVAVGALGDSSGTGRDDLDDLGRQYLLEELSRVPGVEAHAEVPAPEAFRRELQERSLTGIVLQGSVVEIARNGNTVSAVVSVLVLDHDQNLRVMLRGQGNATRRTGVLEESEVPAAQAEALRGAVRAAVNSLGGYLRGL